MHSAFNQFAAFTQDAADNKALAAKGKLAMPVLALGGDHSFRMQMGDIMRLVAANVTADMIHGFRPLGHGGAARRDDGDDRGVHR